MPREKITRERDSVRVVYLYETKKNNNDKFLSPSPAHPSSGSCIVPHPMLLQLKNAYCEPEEYDERCSQFHFKRSLLLMRCGGGCAALREGNQKSTPGDRREGKKRQKEIWFCFFSSSLSGGLSGRGGRVWALAALMAGLAAPVTVGVSGRQLALLGLMADIQGPIQGLFYSGTHSGYREGSVKCTVQCPIQTANG